MRKSKRRRKMLYETLGGGFVGGIGLAKDTSLEDMLRKMKWNEGAQTAKIVFYVATTSRLFVMDGVYEIGFKEQMRQDMLGSDQFGGKVLACWFEGEPVPEEAKLLGYGEY